MKKTLKILDNLYNCFFRCLFRIGTGASIPNFFIQTGMLNPQNLILMRKLNFYHHLANLSPNSLGNQVFKLQSENPSLPSLVKDLEEHIHKLGIEDPTSVSKYAWKKRVNDYVWNKCHSEILDLIKDKKKMNPREYENKPFEKSSYILRMKLEDVRMRMRISSGMINQIKGNYKHKYKRWISQ